MSYIILERRLHPIAEAAKNYFRTQWGIGRFHIEKLQLDIHKPTLSATTVDYHYLWLEVSEKAYLTSLDRVVLKCQREQMPVKLYMVIPKGLADSPKRKVLREYNADVREAENFGVGILEIDEFGVATSVRSALSLSLMGVRKVEVKHFPRKYRQDLSEAERTFRGGQPAKGCALVYDLIEDLCRRAAVQLRAGHWAPQPNKTINFKKCAWDKVMNQLMAHLSSSKACPDLNAALLHRIQGAIPHRNEVGHKLTSRRQLIKRDSQLRTRFETAVDVFADLVEASRPLKRIHMR